MLIFEYSSEAHLQLQRQRRLQLLFSRHLRQGGLCRRCALLARPRVCCRRAACGLFRALLSVQTRHVQVGGPGGGSRNGVGRPSRRAIQCFLPRIGRQAFEPDGRKQPTVTLKPGGRYVMYTRSSLTNIQHCGHTPIRTSEPQQVVQQEVRKL